MINKNPKKNMERSAVPRFFHVEINAFLVKKK
jgi:hypothetical protein